jgi:hypothetical protein
MRVVKQLESDQEVWVDEYSGVRYAPIQDAPSVDPLIQAAQQAIEAADSIRYITDTLHDRSSEAQLLIDYVIEQILDRIREPD